MRRWPAALLLLIFACQAMAQEAKPAEPKPAAEPMVSSSPSLFFDKQDGYLDASDWMLDKKGFLPLPFIITEPALGLGGGLGMLWVRESIQERREQSEPGGHIIPPDLFLAALGGTDNGTKFLAAGGMFTFDNDRWRYRGGIAKADINLDFYGRGIAPGDRKLGYNLDGWFSSQQVMYRLGESNTLVAGRWIYLDIDAHLDPSRPRPNLPPLSRPYKSSGAGPSVEYDSRDNIFTPNTGSKATLEAIFYSPAIGSDDTYQTYSAQAFGYTPVAKTLVLGGRFSAGAARGGVPFYQQPYIDLRGAPVVRYQGENVSSVETELRWNVTPRWALTGFIGAGRAWGSTRDFSDAPTIVGKGVGFRYLIARRLNFYLGADFARAEDETAVYIQLGSAWH